MFTNEQLEKIPETVKDLITVLNKAGYEGYVVGGCVRDMLLGKTPNDWDICTNATTDQTIDVLRHNNYRMHTVGIEHGTVTAMDDTGEYEITTYRIDGEYSDGRHPDKVEFTSSLEEDLKRRDFTINAMAFNPLTVEFIDKFNGVHDLQHRTIRAVGDAKQRFMEDSLRILRALRFSVVYDFDIEEYTFRQMIVNKELLDNVSKERITTEFYKMLTGGRRFRARLMRAHAIVEQIIPEIKPCYNFKQNNKYHAHDVYDHSLLVLNGCAGSSIEVMMAALLHDIGKPKSYVVDENGHGHFYGHPEVSYEIAQKVLEKDFKFTRKTNDEILTLIRNHDMTVASTKASVKRALNKFGEKTLKNWCILKQADMNDHVYVDFSKNNVTDVQYVENMIQEIMAEESCFNLKDLDIDGKIIMNSLGVKPGKHVGIILNTLLKEVIDERVINEQSVLIARAEEILREIQSE